MDVTPNRSIVALLILLFFVYLLSGRMFCYCNFSAGSESSLCVSDVLAERSRRTKPELCSDGAGAPGAAGGDAGNAGPGGVCRASAEQHPATTRRPAPVTAANTPPGPELRTRTGRPHSSFPFSALRRRVLFIAYVSQRFQRLTPTLCVSEVVSQPSASTESTVCSSLQHNDDPSAEPQ